MNDELYTILNRMRMERSSRIASYELSCGCEQRHHIVDGCNIDDDRWWEQIDEIEDFDYICRASLVLENIMQYNVDLDSKDSIRLKKLVNKLIQMDDDYDKRVETVYSIPEMLRFEKIDSFKPFLRR